jgi:hypothetical protein
LVTLCQPCARRQIGYRLRQLPEVRVLRFLAHDQDQIPSILYLVPASPQYLLQPASDFIALHRIANPPAQDQADAADTLIIL